MGIVEQVVATLIASAIIWIWVHIIRRSRGSPVRRLIRDRSNGPCSDSEIHQSPVPNAPDQHSEVRRGPIAVFDVNCRASGSRQVGHWKVAAVRGRDEKVRLWGVTACRRAGILPEGSPSNFADAPAFARALSVPLFSGAAECLRFLRDAKLTLDDDAELFDDDAPLAQRGSRFDYSY